MNDFQREIYKTIDRLTEKKLVTLGFDKTKRGKVVSIDNDIATVQIDGENYDCRLRRGVHVQPNDIVFVKFPQNNNVDKYIETILGGNETPEYLIISAEEILAKLKTVDGHGSGLDADTLDGKHASEFATLGDLDDIDVDISGEAIVDNINASQSIIEDKNLSENVNDTINKKHSHTNKSIIDNIEQDDIDTWDTVIGKSDIRHKHTEVDVADLDKYTKAETDAKLNVKADKTYVDAELDKKSDITHNHDLDYEPKNSNIQSHIMNKANPHSVTKSQVGLANVENKSSATIRSEITDANVTNALGYTPENSMNKGNANGYAPLDGNTKIPLSVLPDIAKQQTYVVETLDDRDDLSALIMGEKCYVTSAGDSYIWDGDSWEILAKADWENVNLQWTNIVGKPSSNVADIDDATSKRHTHGNKSIIDTITQTLTDRWNAAWNHIADVVKHVTPAEKTKWNTVETKADTTYVNTEIAKKSDKSHIHTESDITDLDKYTKSETNVKLDIKVDNARVLTDVPINAKFTDTIYTLPNASTLTLGGVKIGANLSIADDGTLSALSGDERSSFIIKQEMFVATAGQTLFNLTKGHYQPNTNTISVYLYGGKQPNIVLNEISTSSFEITEPLKMGDVVIVEYFELSSATPYPVHGSDHLTDGYDPIPLATVSSEGLMAKEDKAKLSDIQVGANKYTHPATHSLDMITETTNKKILTATEKAKISEVDNKVDKATGKGLSDENYTLLEKNKLAGVEADANKYTHPSNHPASIITESPTQRFVSDSEKTAWNAKETPSGAQTKANQAEQNSKNYTDNVLVDFEGMKVHGDDWHSENYAKQSDIPDISGKTDKTYVDAQLGKKVDKVTGKGLSTEDYSTVEKNKLAGITAGATKNDTDVNLRNRSTHTGTQPASTISDFANSVRATVLTGLSTATNVVIATTDTILSALGKLQKQISDNLATLNSHTGNKSNPHSITKTQLELGNVDNTTDANKPVSNAVNAALSLRALKTDVPIKKNIANTSTDYTDFVVPLCSLDNTSISADYFAQGTIFLKRGNILSGQITSIDIICGKNYNSTNPVFSILKSVNSNMITPVTFTRNGIKYFGLHAKITGSNYTGQHYFVGNATDMDIIDGIYTYNNNTSTIINSEIYNSLEFLTDSSLQKETEFYKSPIVRPMGGSTTYKIWNETNDGSGSGLDADLLDGKQASDFSLTTHTHNYEQAFTKNTAFNKNFGTAAGTVTQGNDARLSDARVPLSHDHNTLYNTKSETSALLDGKVGNARVLTDVPLNAKFTDTIVDISGKANIASPTFTGVPKAPTATAGANTTQLATTAFVQGALSSGGYGDMLKSVYDLNGNGIVDNAEKVNGFTVETNVPANAKFTDTNTIYTHPATHPASIITGLPTSLPASGGQADTAKGLIGDDTRAINSPPSEYMNSGARYLGRAGWQTEFKNIATMGVGTYFSGTYCYVETKNPWSDQSGGYPIQIAYGNGTPVWRVGSSLTAWGDWRSFSESLYVGNSQPTNHNIGWIDTSL